MTIANFTKDGGFVKMLVGPFSQNFILSLTALFGNTAGRLFHSLSFFVCNFLAPGGGHPQSLKMSLVQLKYTCSLIHVPHVHFHVKRDLFLTYPPAASTRRSRLESKRKDPFIN